MQREHEEAMRVDFAERARLNEELFHAKDLDLWDADSDTQERQRDEINTRWSNSPHTEEWTYLTKAHRTWVLSSDRARNFMEWLDHYRELGHEMVSDVERRSLEQAQELSGNIFQVDYERNAPDVARSNPDAPVPVFGRRRSRIERSR